MEKDLKMAHELQMALLPQQFPSIPRGAPPTESAIKFSSFYYPAVKALPEPLRLRGFYLWVLIGISAIVIAVGLFGGVSGLL